jgi:ADP-heptose:LPS heptosyltransferase
LTFWLTLARFTPTGPAPDNPRRIVLIRPCCIGDVVLATATLKALRRHYPDAHITFAVGSWSRRAVENHPLLDNILDTGPDDLPLRSPTGFVRFVRTLRAGRFDLAVSLVRSPLMSLALLLSGIPHRVGLDSGGRGFGYSVRVPVDPAQARHEAEIYLDTARALGIDTDDCYASVPVRDSDFERVRTLRSERGIGERYIVINPAGGVNPGMVMAAKRWPPGYFAALADRLAAQIEAQVVIVAGPDDRQIVEGVRSQMETRPTTFVGELSFGEIAALASEAVVYIGNDTGLTHLAAAAGAKTAMILGPSDPARYAPFTPDSIALWQPLTLGGGVSTGTPTDWNWERDGIGVTAVFERLMTFL